MEEQNQFSFEIDCAVLPRGGDGEIAAQVWQTYRTGQMPRARLLDVDQTTDLVDKGIGNTTIEPLMACKRSVRVRRDRSITLTSLKKDLGDHEVQSA